MTQMSIRRKTAYFVLSFSCVVVIVLTYAAFRWLNYRNEIEGQLKNIFSTIHQPPESNVVYEGACTDIGGGASPSLTCGATYYCGVIGSNLTPDELEQFYNQEFSRQAWSRSPNYDTVFAITSERSIEYIQIKADKPIGVNLDNLAYDIISSAQKIYNSLSILRLSNKSISNCPSK
jgi:hypothetical protein